MIKCILGNIADVTMGQSPKSEYYNFEGHGMPFLQGNRTFGEKYPTFDTYTTMSTKTAKAGDVIMSVRAPVGDLNITPVDICLGRGVCGIRMKNGNQDFLFYLLRYYMPHLINKESGTVFGSINRNDINKLEIEIPEEPSKQIYISRILASLDEKIDINNKINENLSEQIRTLCNAWLNDYIPFGGECPEDWKLTPLSSFANFIGGYSYKSDELQNSSVAMATIKNFNRKGGFKLDGYKEIVASGKLKSEHHVDLFDTLVAHTDLTQNAEVIGNAEPVLSFSNYSDIIFSMDIVKVVPTIPYISKYLLAALLQTQKFKEHCLGYVNGTTVLHLSKKALQDYSLMLPQNFAIIKPLDDIVTSIYQQMAFNIDECSRLEKIRDNLLPQLMSGELDVSSIDI
ncbi:MAG: restriction endonuclease subunit S [Spirochaetia bacterium]|nr:restriction endonuclease subunit S [Spirochaetia bacterium]